jgi:hypothetical protein
MEEENSILDTHRMLIKDVYSRLVNMKKWPLFSYTKKVQIFKNETHCKQECILNCSVDRAFVMLSDKSPVTRKQWDPRCDPKLTQLEEFKLNDGTIYTVGSGIIGVQWERKPSFIIFKKCYTHPMYKQKKESDEERLIWLKSVDENKTFVTIISLGTPYPEDIFNCMESANFTQIYSPWKCPTCRNMVFAHELECRACKQERYGRCPVKTCIEAFEQGATSCSFCKAVFLPAP